MVIGASIAVLAICAGPAEAVLLAYEGFDYEPGELSGENGGFGWDEPWEILGHNVSDDAGSLVYEGNPNSVTGEQIGGVWSASCGPYRRLAPSAEIDLNDDSTWYVSALFVQNSTIVSGPAMKLMEGNVITPGGGGSADTLHRGWVTGINSGMNYWYGGTTGYQYDGGYELGEVMMVVSKIEGDSGDGYYHIYYNWYESPETVPTTEPGSWERSKTLDININRDVLDNICVWGSRTREHQFDEFRLGTTYGDVVGDVVTIPEPPGPVPGDFDEDGDVDGVDFSHWQMGYPTASGSDLDHGDADGDGDTDGTDFGLWQTNYPSNVGGAATIPEPATIALLLIGGLALLNRRHKASPNE